MKCDEISSANIRLDPIGIPNRKVTTNADRIRNMSDEELASWYVIKCEIMMGIKCQKPYKTCKDCIFEWLRSETE